MKRCSKCGEEKSLEAFGRDKNRSDGLFPQCKGCKRVDRIKTANNPTPSGDLIRQCIKCGEVKFLKAFPPSRAYKDGISRRCKPCARAYDESLRRKKGMPVRTKDNLAKDGLKRCSICKELKPVSAFHKNRSRRDGLHSDCRSCFQTPETKIRTQKWRASNPEKRTALHYRRESRKKHNGGYFTAKDIAHMRAIQQGHCCYCGRTGFRLSIDHILPVKQGGPSDPWNIALCCRTCNSSKGGRTPEQWVDRWYLR